MHRLIRARRATKNLVFISHATVDTWIAQHIAADIEREGRRFGVTTFVDAKDISPGELINESLRRNLRECFKFVVLLSPASVTRPWVLLECGAADLGLDKEIVPILDKVKLGDVPQALTRYKAIDLNDLEKNLAKIVQPRQNGCRND